MEIVTVVNRKGGVGKTATAQALGAGLTRKGFKVLLIDLDSQCNLTYALDAMGAQYSSMDVLSHTVSARDAITHTEQGDIIAGAEAIAGADTMIIGTGKEYRLKEALEDINGLYDYIIIDTPASLGVSTVNALTVSEKAIITVQADIYSLQGIGLVHNAIESVRKYCNPSLVIDGILITRYNGRAVISKDMQSNFDEVAKQMGTTLYDTTIRECISVKEAQASQLDLFTYSPRCNAAKDYLQFIDEFIG